jgi:hypothetical protein
MSMTDIHYLLPCFELIRKLSVSLPKQITMGYLSGDLAGSFMMKGGNEDDKKV